MPTPRTRTVATAVLALMILPTGAATRATGVEDPQPSVEVALFRQGERAFANRHDAPCGSIPAYGDGACATRRRT